MHVRSSFKEIFRGGRDGLLLISYMIISIVSFTGTLGYKFPTYSKGNIPLLGIIV